MSFFHALLCASDTGETTFLFAGAELDILNRYVDISFNPDVYHSTGGALLASDLQIVFSQNGGVATGASISSLTTTAGGALSGGESIVRVNISITGNASGVETIYFKASAVGSFKNSLGDFVTAADRTSDITLEKELDAMYKAGILAALTASITPPLRAQRLIDNAIFVSWRAATGILTELDIFYLSTWSNDFTKVDFVSGTVKASVIDTPSMTPYVGVHADSILGTGYFDLNWNPQQGSKFLQNDGSFITVIQNNAQGANYNLGSRGSGSGVNFGHCRFSPRLTTDQAAASLNINNSGNSFLVSNTDSSGRYIVSREASNLTRMYRNGSQIGTGATASNTLSNQDWFYCNVNDNGTPRTPNKDHNMMMIAAGSGMQDKIADIDGALDTWSAATQALLPNLSGRVYGWIGQSNVDRSTGTYTDFDAHLQGPMAGVYIWWDNEWQILELGVNGCNANVNFGGPIYEFAYQEKLKYPATDLFIVNHAIGGTPLESQWLPGGTHYVRFINKYNAAISQMSSVTSYGPCIWGQGEQDATDLTKANNYEVNEQTFIAQLLSDTSFTDLIVMQIHDKLPADVPYVSTVRAAKQNNFNAGEYGTIGDLINIDDLVAQDDIHLSPANSTIFGGRLSAACP